MRAASTVAEATPTPWDWLPVAHTVLLVALVLGLTLSISVSQIALGALAAWLLLARRAGRIPALRAPLLVPIAVFAVWSVVAALASERPLESLYESKSLLNLAALFVIVNALPDAATARRFATWLLIALAGAAALAVVQVAACPGPEAAAPSTTLAGSFLRKCARARGFYSIYMTLGGVLAMTLTAALPRLARVPAEAWWLGPAWIIGVAALGLTYVRGAWLGFAAGAMAAVAGLGRRGLIAAVAVAALVPALLVGLPGVGERFRTIGNAADDTTRDRLAMLEAGRRLGVENPVTGVGPGQLKHAYARVAPPQALRRSTSHLHNTPLQILVERGIVGLGAWLWIFAAFLIQGISILRTLPREAPRERALVLGSLAAIVTFLVAGLFEYNFGDTEVLLVAMALMALPFALGRGRAPARP
ncbi:MAG TPA: O-antigen ligase family protein [Methylomirabilota bacterium]